MTPEEAMRIRSNPTSEDADIKELQKCIDEALEKQIPKKPTVHIKGTTGYNTLTFCPECSNNVGCSSRYCPRCGQAIDWSVEKK